MTQSRHSSTSKDKVNRPPGPPRRRATFVDLFALTCTLRSERSALRSMMVIIMILLPVIGLPVAMAQFYLYPPIDPTSLASALNVTTDCLATL